MHRRRSGASLLPQIVAYFLLAFFFGCDTWPGADPTGGSSVRPSDPNASQLNEDVGNNNLFNSAQAVPLPADGEITVNGRIDNRDDVDFFSLGPAKAGDRITVDVTGAGGLNTVAALFDGNKGVIETNDDRSYYAGQLDPYLNRVIRRDMDNVYLAVAIARAKYFSSTAGRFDSGDYSVRILRRPGQIMPEARRQVVLLNFGGGASVQIALQPAETMSPFSAEAISSRFAGQTGYIADQVVARMRADFADYNVLLVDGRTEAPPDGPFTTMYFGNFNQAFLGLSDNVDTDNAVLDQKGIIYTEDFRMFESLQPTVDEVAQAIANTGSHEVGHLLGLEHADYYLDIMATAATARQILENDAWFQLSPLDAGVFPAGLQDGPAILLQNVGAHPGGAARWILPEAGAGRDKSKTAWRAQYDFVMPVCGRPDHVAR